MAAQKKFKISHKAGQHLLNFMLAGPRMPERLGSGDDKEEFDVAERSYLDELMVRARAAMLAFCTRVKETKEFLFGSRENWLTQKPEHCPNCRIPLNGVGTPASEMIDPDLPFEIRLDEDVVEGVFWALYLSAHPLSPTARGGQFLADVTWPVAKAIGYDRELASKIKLDKRKARALRSNEHRDWAKAEAAAAALKDVEDKPEALPAPVAPPLKLVEDKA